MSGNISPVYSKTGKIGFAPAILTANTAKDGTGTVSLVFTAGVEGAYVRELRAKPIGTNTQSVMRIFINNGSDPTTATNNVYLDDMLLPSTTLSETAPMLPAVYPLNFALPPGYRIYVTIGTTVAAGWVPSVIGGDY